jgi:hypothetical protein
MHRRVAVENGRRRRFPLLPGGGRPVPYAAGLPAFTLLEVMIAMAIFFMAVFAILELVATNLRNARLLEQPRVDCGLVMADLSLSNELEVGSTEVDLSKVYPGYHCVQYVDSPEEYCDLPDTNGLRYVYYILTRPDGTTETNLVGLMWKPNSKPIKSGP